jgi:NAD(P)-dependent dehydrogenase (short-subunit alcohol dehydrogenase family)
MSTALITGASAGLGRELAYALGGRGWNLVLDARGVDRLSGVGTDLPAAHLIAGDVAHPAHRAALLRRLTQLGGIDLLVNNASSLGGSPQPALVDLSPEVCSAVFDVNVVAPAALIAALIPQLTARRGVVLNISSDAAVEHYEGWGAYGASKAALDHLTLTFAAENPEIAFYAVDPGDMRTEMQQRAFPGEDISDRPLPSTVIPSLIALIDQRPPSGRYRASEFATITELAAT